MSDPAIIRRIAGMADEVLGKMRDTCKTPGEAVAVLAMVLAAVDRNYDRPEGVTDEGFVALVTVAVRQSMAVLHASAQ